MSEDLEVKLRGHNEDLLHKLRESGEQVAELKEKIMQVGEAIMAAFAVEKIYEMVEATLKLADEQSDLAAVLGSTQGQIATMQAAAQLAGDSTDALTRSMSILQKQLGEAQLTGAGVTPIINALGLSVEKLAKMPADEKMIAVREALEKVDDPTQRAAASMQLLGRGWAEIADIDTSTIEKARKNVEDFGLSLSEVDKENFEHLHQNLTSLDQATQGLKNQFSAGLAPILADITDKMLENKHATKNYRDTIQSLGEIAIPVLGGIADIGEGIYGVFQIAAGAASGLAAGVVKVLEGLYQLEAGYNYLLGDIKEQKEAQEEANKAGLLASVLYDQMNARAEKFNHTIEGESWGKKLEDYIHKLKEVNSEQEKSEKHGENKHGGGIDLSGVLDPNKDAEKDTRDRDIAALDASLRSRREKEMFDYTERLKIVQKYFMEKGHLTAEGQARLEKLAIQHKQNLAKFDEEDKKELINFRKKFTDKRTMEAEQYAQELKDLKKFHDAKRISELEYTADREAIEQRHQKVLEEIEKEGWSARQKFEHMSLGEQVTFTLGSLKELTAGVAQHNKGMFELNKMASLADAAVHLPAAVMKTLAAYPYPLNIGMAAATAAAGLAQIQAIRATSFQGGGSGSAPSVAGTTPAPAVSPVGGGSSGGAGGGPNRSLDINVSGIDPNALFSGAQLRTLMTNLTSELKDGATIGKLSFG